MNDNCIGTGAVRHIYVHIPFCARICPYCAFYKERADPAQTARFCEAIVAELRRTTNDGYRGEHASVDASLCEARERGDVNSRAFQRKASTAKGEAQDESHASSRALQRKASTAKGEAREESHTNSRAFQRKASTGKGEARDQSDTNSRAFQRKASTAKASRLKPQTIFFGGGTPTALTTAQLATLLEAFQATLDLSELVEWTFEANPGSVSERKAQLLRERGVTRISLGVQSFDDGLLQLLGRDHSAAQAEASFDLLRRSGFENLNVDLMFGLPGQTLGQWRQTLERALALQPDHVSAYCLTYEEDTDFFLRHARGEFREDEEAEAAFFETTAEVLDKAGLAQYEVSNFARAGFESVHNRAYWRGEDYLGIGPSAVSTIGWRRWQNVCDYRAYADRALAGESAATGDEILTPEMKRAEAIALGLRTGAGVPAEWMANRPNEAVEFVGLGLMERRDDRFVLTRSGRLLADSVAEAFV